jgi:hypothetical protein
MDSVKLVPMKFFSWEGIPAISEEASAWVLPSGASSWMEVGLEEILSARGMAEASFMARFPNVPPLPIINEDQLASAKTTKGNFHNN